ncbi:MAG: hypothetical protein IKI93_18915 [Clostridia bacterium]|nr:hypothetical protein [Clostridia bacterium]
MKEIRDKETLWHDTQLLLRKYRQVKWALEVSSQQALKELQQRTGGTLDTFLHAAVFAGADISNTHLEGRAQSLERSRKMLALINESVDFMRRNHPRGELYYQTIYYFYLSPKELTINGILNEMEKDGYIVSDTTLRKHRNEAVRIIGEILWGYDDLESKNVLNEIVKGN